MASQRSPDNRCDINGAKSSLLESVKVSDGKSAWPYYLLAVAGARSGDPSVLVTNLRKAVGVDNKLKDKARADLEFRKYFTNDQFKAAIN